jgi:hypothetical protein
LAKFNFPKEKLVADKNDFFNQYIINSDQLTTRLVANYPKVVALQEVQDKLDEKFDAWLPLAVAYQLENWDYPLDPELVTKELFFAAFLEENRDVDLLMPTTRAGKDRILNDVNVSNTLVNKHQNWRDDTLNALLKDWAYPLDSTLNTTDLFFTRFLLDHVEFNTLIPTNASEKDELMAKLDDNLQAAHGRWLVDTINDRLQNWVPPLNPPLPTPEEYFNAFRTANPEIESMVGDDYSQNLPTSTLAKVKIKQAELAERIAAVSE